MIATVLVVGGSSSEREQAIANSLGEPELTHKSAILIEGLSDGKFTIQPDQHILVARIASGCLCCSNNMIMRIYLNRLIQQKPQQLFISLATAAHLAQIQEFLAAAPYQTMLELGMVIKV